MSQSKTYINGKEVTPSDKVEVLQWEGDRLTLRKGANVFTAVARTVAENSKEVEVFLNGSKYPVSVKDRTDLILEEMGMDVTLDPATEDLRAPMPGLVVDTLVESGSVVEKGSPLLVLEAMKMENMIKAEGEATVNEVLVKSGDAVEKGQLMITFKK